MVSIIPLNVSYITTKKENRLKATYSLEPSQVKRLNKKEGHGSYKVGDTSKRFFSRNHAIQTSVEQILSKDDTIKLIVISTEGEGILNPCKVVYCVDKDIQLELNKVYKELEEYYKISNNPWSVPGNNVDDLYDEWERLLSKLNP